MSTVGISGSVIFLFGLPRISFNFLADSLLRLWLSDWMFASVAERNLSCVRSSLVETFCVRAFILCLRSNALVWDLTATSLRWLESSCVRLFSDSLNSWEWFTLMLERCGKIVMRGFLSLKPLGVRPLISRVWRYQCW